MQEILSVKEDSENILNDEFYDDNNDLLDENDADSVEKVEDSEPYYDQMNGKLRNSYCEFKLLRFCVLEEQDKSAPVNNKTDWPKIPKIPQVPVMANIPTTNSFNNVNSNTPLNDMAYKLDQILGMTKQTKPNLSSLRWSLLIDYRIHADTGLSNIRIAKCDWNEKQCGR